MKIDKKDLLIALGKAGKYARPGNIKKATLVLIDSENQRLVATDYESYWFRDITIRDYKREIRMETDAPMVKPEPEFQLALDTMDYIELRDFASNFVNSQDMTEKDEIIRALIKERMLREQMENSPVITTKTVPESFAFDPRKLRKVIATVPEKLIEMKISEVHSGELVGAKVAMLEIAGVFQEIRAIPPDDFADIEEFDVKKAGVVDAEGMLQVAKITSLNPKDKPQDHFNSVFLDAKDSFITGTDGERLHLYRLNGFKANSNAIIPSVSLKNFLADNRKEHVTVSVGAKAVEFKTGRENLVVKTVEADYPRAQNPIAKAMTGTKINVSKAPMGQVIDQASNLTDKDYSGMFLEFRGKTIMSRSYNPIFGRYQSEKVQMKSGKVKDPFEIFLKILFLKDALDAINSDVFAMRVSDDGPMLIKQGNFEAVLSPMRTDA